MRTYITYKLLHAFGVAFVISVVSFFLLFYTADPASMLLPETADDADIAAFEHELGLDRPLIVQYGSWLSRIVFEADFGVSWVAKVPASELIGVALWPTLKLAFAAQIIATALAIPLGLISAVKRYSITDNITTFIVLVGQAMPLFWLGIMLMIVFGVWLKWLPTSGSDTWMHLILPAITLASFTLPLNMRLVRSGMLEVLSQDYVRTARAKGVDERRVLLKHAFRNAAIPLVTVTGVQFGALLGGAVVTETVFSWPGLGRLAVESIQVGDFPVVQGVVLILSAFTIVANLAADIGSAWIDPENQIRMSETTPEAIGESHLDYQPSTVSIVLKRMWQLRMGVFGFVLVLVLVLGAIFAPQVATHDPLEQDILARLTPPIFLAGGDDAYILGTDQLGRDLYSRIVYGARISLMIGLSAVFVSMIIGVSLGLIAGYFGGKVDAVVDFMVNAMLAFPFILLAMTLVIVLGASMENIILALGLSNWPIFARVTRIETMKLREQEFVLAAVAQGLSHLRIIFKHILSNLAAPILVIATVEIARAIIRETFLSFLGLGIQPPTPSWGLMLAEGRDYMLTIWWLSTLPGAAIFLAALGINLVGDALRDLLDPRMRQG